MIVDVLTIISICFGLGVGIQTAFFKEGEAERYFTRFFAQNQPQRFMDFNTEFANYVYTKIFSGYFGENILTLRYIVRSTLFSLLMLSIVILYFLFGDYDSVYSYVSSRRNITTLVVFFLCNIVIDIVSLYQTQSFIYLMARCKNLFQVFLVLFSDVIITLNMFIFIFAFFIFLYVNYIIFFNVNSNVDGGVSVIARIIKEDTPNEAYENSFIVRSHFLNEANQTIYERQSGLMLANVDSIDPTEFVSAGKFRDIRYEVNGETYNQNEALRIINTTKEIEYRVIAGYVPDKLNYNLWPLYALIYLNVDKLEFDFLRQIRPSFNVIELNQIIAPGALRYGPYYDTRHCKYEVEELGGSKYIEEDILKQHLASMNKEFECHEPLLFINGRRYSDDTVYLLFSNVTGRIPGNIYLLTSFFGTIILYFVYTATLLGRYVFQLVFYQEGQAAKLVRRNALGFLGLIIGTLLSVPVMIF